MPDLNGRDEWVHIDRRGEIRARRNAADGGVSDEELRRGLRTSPVKRGNWVVKNVLGERIPPPPAGGAGVAAR